MSFNYVKVTFHQHSSLRAWTSGFAELLSTCNSVKFLLITLFSVTWTKTFYSRPVFTLHINSLSPLLKQMSHQPVPGLSEHIQSMPATQQGCGELSWAPAASQPPSLSTGHNSCTGTWVRSSTCHGHPPDIPTQARHSNAALHISFISHSHNLLLFIPRSRNKCEAKTQEVREKQDLLLKMLYCSFNLQHAV